VLAVGDAVFLTSVEALDVLAQLGACPAIRLFGLENDPKNSAIYCSSSVDSPNRNWRALRLCSRGTIEQRDLTSIVLIGASGTVGSLCHKSATGGWVGRIGNESAKHGFTAAEIILPTVERADRFPAIPPRLRSRTPARRSHRASPGRRHGHRPLASQPPSQDGTRLLRARPPSSIGFDRSR
jgi:hypothetical protein